MITGYYKLKPIKMLNIDGHDFLFSDILSIFDNFTSYGGKMHAFMDEFDDDVMDDVRILSKEGYFTYKAVDLMYTEVTVTVKGEKLYNDIMSGHYTCKPVEEAVY